ncbi:hypothetical protein [Chryseobacterium oryctis]|uniref:Immunity protein 50 n=1 Tax=Chryseobacterium oryctis TaxID=2952618 RepID=A0ABT3HK81_9FLAO|nr:hypothetical protein [Chryseobacterium oryctis]MCW3160200.1 hypothetical protein [Chryseobacterium oryctis]
MIHPFIAFIKKDVYEKTQYNILKHKIDKSATICFSEKDLLEADWKEEKEFVLKGFSYDVINITMVNGTKYYNCYIDKKDLVINSLLRFSGFFTIKTKRSWKNFEIPSRVKKRIKTSNSLITCELRELNSFNLFYLKLKLKYFKRLENTHYLSITVPPPEMIFCISK